MNIICFLSGKLSDQKNDFLDPDLPSNLYRKLSLQNMALIHHTFRLYQWQYHHHRDDNLKAKIFAFDPIWTSRPGETSRLTQSITILLLANKVEVLSSIFSVNSWLPFQ